MANQQYEKLKVKWDKKLKDSGFEDIENKDGSLKSSTDPRTIATAMRDGRAEYYNQAGNFLNTFSFPKPKEQLIWYMHCNGDAFRYIAKVVGVTFYEVRTIVVKYQKLAGLRK